MVKKYSKTALSVHPVGAAGSSAAATTGGAVADLTRDGVSVLSARETYTLEAPAVGARKTLVFASSTTTAGCTIRGSTATTVTFNAAGATQIVFPAASTEYQCVELLGLSSTKWTIVSAYPVASSGPGPTFGTS